MWGRSPIRNVATSPSPPSPGEGSGSQSVAVQVSLCACVASVKVEKNDQSEGAASPVPSIIPETPEFIVLSSDTDTPSSTNVEMSDDELVLTQEVCNILDGGDLEGTSQERLERALRASSTKSWAERCGV